MTTEDLLVLKEEARLMKLVYISDAKPGYTRQQGKDGFVFFDTKGELITDGEEIKRIRGLVIPPAWTNVWICPKANGHLQATGIDAAGRKQYKYHKEWSAKRNERKHSRMVDFAKALPAIRAKLERDLNRREFVKDKVVAIAICVMDKTFIRVGNSVYTKLYGSYGLTGLRNKHIKIMGNSMQIAFIGKKGVAQEISLTHSRLSRLMKKLKDIPGQELFQFYDIDGTKKSIDSGCINEYLHAVAGNDFTAKDFRTWWGTVTAFEYLSTLDKPQSNAEAQRNIIAALDTVAKKLGNTRTVCKKYYVNPTLLSCYAEGRLDKYFARLKKAKQVEGVNIFKVEEKLVSEFIKNECAN